LEEQLIRRVGSGLAIGLARVGDIRPLGALVVRSDPFAAGVILRTMHVLRESSEDEMVACFLQGEMSSRRFGPAIRAELAVSDQPEELLSSPDLADQQANQARRGILAATRGYGENRELFKHFPSRVRWVWARLTPTELARVRYIEYSYWNELSCGTRLPVDAAKRIQQGVRAYGVSNQPFLSAARAVARGEQFPPLILAGQRRDRLVCLEGHVRLTAHALAGFPVEVEALVGTARTMGRWAQ
jgi:hypothetical protein